MRNNAHFTETIEKRLARFQSNTPVESIETLLNSIDNHLNNEIALTIANTQTSLLFLGIHAVSLTISEVFWNLHGEQGYTRFVREFMDGNSEDKKFSIISNKIHSWRNVLAHQWLAASGHGIQYDYQIEEGYVSTDNLLILNPRIYCEQYLKAFSVGGKIWKYDRILTRDEQEMAKKRIISKFVNG